MASSEVLPPLSEDDMMLSGLCYPGWFFAPGFVLLSSKKDDPFICFHAIQGLAFGILSSLATLGVVLAVWLLFQVLPNTGQTGYGMLGAGIFGTIFVFGSVMFLASIFIGWQASAGSYLKLPGLGAWSENKMVQLLGIEDFDAFKNSARAPQVAVAAPLEDIPFPVASGVAAARGIDPEVAANYARQLLQNQQSAQSQSASFRPPAPPPARPAMPPRSVATPPPTPARGAGALPSAFQRTPRPIQPTAPSSPPLRPRDSNPEDSQSAGRWISSRKPGDG